MGSPSNVTFGLPGANLNRIRVPAGPENYLDKATIVSILPVEVDERKPTIQPGRFFIPSGRFESPSILIVGRSTWWKEVDENQVFEVANSAYQVAESVVNDYSGSIQEASRGEGVGPGLFFLEGCKLNAETRKPDFNNTLEWVMTEHADKLANANRNQNEWFLRLVNMADALWTMSDGNPLAISNLMKMAARELNMHDKEWLKNYQEAQKKTCPACGFMNKPAVIICTNCKVILDKERFKSLGLEFANNQVQGFQIPGNLK